MPYPQPPSGMNSSDLPPDAAQMLSGMAPQSPGGGAGNATDDTNGGGGIPGFGMTGSTGAGPGAMAGMGGMNGTSNGTPNGNDPMMMVKSQFDDVTTSLQMLATNYPMATEELQEAGTAIARAMLKIAQTVQQPPTTPPVPA